MEAEKYLLEQLKKRELFNCNTDDCYQVLAEIMGDYVHEFANFIQDYLDYNIDDKVMIERYGFDISTLNTKQAINAYLKHNISIT